MEAKAVGRYLRVAPRKARYVLDTVCGKSADEALAMLKFMPNEAARYIQQIVESAVANAENNYAMDRETLRISRAYVDQGPSLKRMQPRAMGRTYRILKRMSHITVVLEEDETLKETVAKAKDRRSARRTEETAETAPAESKAAAEKKPAEPKAAGKRKTARAKPASKRKSAKSESTPTASVEPAKGDAASAKTISTDTPSGQAEDAEAASERPEGQGKEG